MDLAVEQELVVVVVQFEEMEVVVGHLIEVDQGGQTRPILLNIRMIIKLVKDVIEHL